MKKNLGKRLLCSGLAVAMAGTVLAGCGSGGSGSTQTTGQQSEGTDAGDTAAASSEAPEGEPVELTLFLDNMNIVDGSYAKTEIEKATNTKLNIIQAAPAEMDNKLNIMLASGEIPDIFQCETETMEGKLLSSGILLPYNEYWDNYPNIKNGRSEETWDLMRYKDGNIYSIGVESQNPLYIMGYRKDWLDNLGLEKIYWKNAKRLLGE